MTTQANDIKVTFSPSVYRCQDTKNSRGELVKAYFQEVPLSAVIKGIQNGIYANTVTPARMEYLENGKSKEYAELKKQIPVVAFAGVFGKQIDNASLLRSSGIFNVDIDKLTKEEAKECIEHFKTIPECIFAFISPSADGVKAGIRIGPVNNDFEYKQYFEPVNELINPYINDPSVKDVRRLCYMSHDKDAYYNPDAQVFEIELAEYVEKERVEYVKPANADDDNVLQALDFLSPNEYHDWIKYGQALKSGGYSFEVFARWSSSYDGFDHDQCLKKWESFKPNAIAPGTIVYDAMQKGFFPSFQAPEIDYDSLPDTEINADSISDRPAPVRLFDLAKSSDFYLFIDLCIDKVGKETREIEAIDKISDLIVYQSKGFTKSLADHIAKSFCEKVPTFSKSKTSIKTGIIDKIKQKERKNQANDFKQKGIYPLDTPIPPESFPNYTMSADGNISVQASLPNLKHLLKSYGIAAVYDEAIKKQELIIPSKESLGHDLHNDAMIQEVVSLAEINGIKPAIVDMLSAIMTENTINPVKDWITSREWDGKSRLPEFYQTLVIKPEGRALAHKILKTWLVQCVAALDRAKIGCSNNIYAVPKYELILVLQGEQGLNKTKWYGDLLPRFLNGKVFSNRYIKDGSSLQLDNKDSIKQNISCWINELGELDATFKKSDISQLKAFCSLQSDKIRLPYAKAENDFTRAVSFAGSVNDEKFLGDETGSRRFGVIAVTGIRPFNGDLQQLWREIWDLYVNGEQWWLDKDTEQAMQQNNTDNHKISSSLDDRVATCFKWDSPSELWTNRLTATGIYAVCFEHGKPTQKELIQIKPLVVGRFGVKSGVSMGVSIYYMPELTQVGCDVVDNQENDDSLIDFSNYNQ